MAIFANPGFNVEIVEYKNVSFTVQDVGGQDKVSISINRLFHIFLYRYDPFGDINFITFKALFLWWVENDRERISKAKDELHRMLSEVDNFYELCEFFSTMFRKMNSNVLYDTIYSNFEIQILSFKSKLTNTIYKFILSRANLNRKS